MEFFKSCYASIEEFISNENLDIKDNIPETDRFNKNTYIINQIENDSNNTDDNEKNVRNYPKIIVIKKIIIWVPKHWTFMLYEFIFTTFIAYT